MIQCKAKSKRSGFQCKNRAVKGKFVCRMHGAFAGPKTAKGKRAIKDANTKHGGYSQEALKERKSIRKVISECKAYIKALDS